MENKKTSVQKHCPNFIAGEDSVIAAFCMENYTVLFSKFSSSISSKMKEIVWKELVSQVNA
jgi:glutathione peroxidase-family protein